MANNQQSLFKVRDARAKDRFQIDDLYLNGWAKKCGWQATLVYISLCRHANMEAKTFPSIALIAGELNIGRNTVLKGIKYLLNFNIITSERKRSIHGTWLSNTYILMDKSVWGTNQVLVEDLGQPSPCGDETMSSSEQTKSLLEQNQVPVEDTKELSEGIKEKELSEGIMSASADAFNQFWLAYPKKELKKKSSEIWKSKKLDSLLSEILAFVENAKLTDRWKKGYIKQPPAFLNGECWNDDLSGYNDKNQNKLNNLLPIDKDKYANL